MLSLSVERELAEGQSWDTALTGAVCPPVPIDVWSLSFKPQSASGDKKFLVHQLPGVSVQLSRL